MDRSATELESTLALAMSAAERKVIETMPLLNEGVVAAVQQTSKEAVQLSVTQMDDLADALSAKANHTEGRMLQRRIDTLVRKIDRLTSSHLLTLLETKVPGVQPAGSVKPKRNRPMLAVTLTPTQRETLARVCPRKSIHQRLQGDGLQTIEFTHREIEYLHDQARMGVASASSRQKKRLLSVCNRIGKSLGESHLCRHQDVSQSRKPCPRQTW
jgi:hypothetical protein